MVDHSNLREPIDENLSNYGDSLVTTATYVSETFSNKVLIQKSKMFKCVFSLPLTKG